MENKRTQHKWTKEEIEYLKEITPGHHHKEILELMNEKFEYQFGLKQVAGAIKRYNLKTGFTGHFKKGSEPWNKGTKGLTGPNRTSFKKGETIHPNYRPVGSERLNRDGYIVNQDGYRIPLDVHSDNWLVYEDMMTFKGAVRQMIEGKRVRIAWWRKDKFIELRADGFYNEKGKLEDLDTLKLNDEWELFE